MREMRGERDRREVPLTNERTDMRKMRKIGDRGGNEVRRKPERHRKGESTKEHET